MRSDLFDMMSDTYDIHTTSGSEYVFDSEDDALADHVESTRHVECVEDHGYYGNMPVPPRHGRRRRGRDSRSISVLGGSSPLASGRTRLKNTLTGIRWRLTRR